VLLFFANYNKHDINNINFCLIFMTPRAISCWRYWVFRHLHYLIPNVCRALWSWKLLWEFTT